MLKYLHKVISMQLEPTFVSFLLSYQNKKPYTKLKMSHILNALKLQSIPFLKLSDLYMSLNSFISRSVA